MFAGAWFLIGKWSEHQEKLKKLEVREVLSAVTALDDHVKDHKKAIQALELHINDWKMDMFKVQTVMTTNAARDEDTSIRIGNIIKVFNERVSSIEDTLADGEIIRLGDNRFMFKGKKISKK